MKDEFLPPSPLVTPVLFLIFNRPDTTQRVFNAIKKAKPKQLFIAADGPRENVKGEKERCEQARKIIEQLDWDCEVKTLSRDKNLGCKIAVSSAIDWFFGNVEEGIILEDDCLPSQSFFWFCQEMLKYYKNDNSIMHITGSNSQFGKKIGDASYFFSKYGDIWGWATWRRVWKYYDVEMKKFPKFKKDNQMINIFRYKKMQNYYSYIFEKVYNGKINTWDYQWSFARLIDYGISIQPNVNLIQNIGFGIDATHTHKEIPLIVNNFANNIDFPLIHPFFKIPNNIADKKYFIEVIYRRNIFLIF